MSEECAICGCALHRTGDYATPTVAGRSHATKHHYVAERFFGRTANRRGAVRDRIFAACPWGMEEKGDIFCYECHELLLHNPVLLPEDVARFSDLVRRRGLSEEHKPEDFKKLAGRIELFHEVIARGIASLHQDELGKNVRSED